MNTYADIAAGLAAGLWPDAPVGKRPLFMWGEPGAEHLTDCDPDDAIEAEVEKYLIEDGLPSEDGSQEWSDPETVTVAVYERRRLPENFEHPESVLEHVLGQLEEYGDPDLSVAEEMTPAMVEAARVFLAVVREEFQVWACDEVEEFEIDVADWRQRTGR